MAELHIIRGLPGSGKSTFAKTLDIPFIEADQYFTDFNGRYIYDPNKVKDAHAWCQKRVKEYLSRNESVAVANVFTKLWQIEIYLDMAKRFNAKAYIHECKGKFQNIHDVPEDAIAKMEFEWENIPSWYQHLVK